MSIGSAPSLPVRAMDAHFASYSGAGALNINHGAGCQENYNQSGGQGNQQFNGPVTNNTWHQAAPERRETPPLPGSTVPFHPDPHFVERKELAELKRTLSSPRQRAALDGLGGVGKSQLAIEYCHRVRKESPETWVLWLHASSAARFDASIRKLADDVKIFGRKDPNADIYQLTYDWLRNVRNGSWVIVLDNADEAEYLLHAPSADAEGGNGRDRTSARRVRMEYLPICEHGSVLITSRYRTMAEKLVDDCDIITVRAMEREHAVALLEKKIGQATNMADLEKLAAALEYMPLAITQASAYIRKRAPRCSVEQYLAEFEESERSRTSLLAVDSGELRLDREAAKSVLVTWQISFEHVSKTTPSAADLLSLMSFFDYQDIPEYVLRADKDESQPDRWTGQSFEDDVRTLRDYHFVSVPSRTSFAMHRLVQLAARKWLESRGQYQRWARQSVQKLDAVLPNGDYANWSRCRELSAHARLALEMPVKERQARVWRASILYKAAWFAWTQRQATEAQVLAEAYVQETTSMLGRESEETLCGEAMLALLLQYQRQYEAAESMNRRVLEGVEKALGVEHPDTLTTVSNLAAVLRYQGKYEAAEVMNRRALEGREKALGAEHPDTLTTVNNLAIVLQCQGKHEAAEVMNRRALEGREKTLGAEHPDTLTTVSNLAVILQHQRKHEAAELMNRRALEGIEKALGAEHPDTLTTVSNLALVLQYQGKYEAAKEMHRRALEGMEKALGAEHPDTLTSVYCLAFLFQQVNDHDTAMDLYYRAHAGYLKTLGRSHPTTIQCSNHMSSLQRGIRVVKGEDVVEAETTLNAIVTAEEVSRPIDSTVFETQDRNDEQQPMRHARWWRTLGKRVSKLLSNTI